MFQVFTYLLQRIKKLQFELDRNVALGYNTICIITKRIKNKVTQGFYSWYNTHIQNKKGNREMAYMNQEKKKEIAKLLKEKLKGRDIKYTLGVKHHSSIVMNINKGSVDFIKNYNDNKAEPRFNNGYEVQANGYISVNEFHIEEHFTGEAKEILEIANDCLNLNNFDKSDAMTDYFHVGHYVEINVGRWDKDYQLTGEK